MSYLQAASSYFSLMTFLTVEKGRAPNMKSKTRNRWSLIGSMLGLALLAAVGRWAWAEGPQTRGPERIEHIVIIYLENRSFDNLYGHFPGANGLHDPTNTATQPNSQVQLSPPLPPA